ncbi:MAG: T9SS type A sorting domain-containing protein [Melioribacteraceae bacterium]|nr:T9SS type A sorting domain-containing protein [Melioribacteraceae bacterium]
MPLVIPMDGDGFLNFYDASSSFFDNSIYTFGIGVFDQNNNLIERKPLRSVDLGWCGTGYLGIYKDVIPKEDYFILIGTFNGIHERRFFDYSGEEITDLGDGIDNVISEMATLSSAAANSAGQYANLYYRIEFYEDYFLQCDFYDESNNKTDSLILQEFGEGEELWSLSYGERKLTRVVPDPNDNFILTWLHPYDGKIYYTKVSPQGSLLYDKPRTLNINDSLTMPSINSFSISQFTNDNVKMVLSYKVDESVYGGEYAHALLELNSDFDIINSLYEVNNIYIEAGITPVFDENENLLIGRIHDKDAYLAALNNFEITGEMKLNDDQTGANQYSSTLRHMGNDNYLVVWRDEVGWKGREIDKANNFISEQINLPNSSVIYSDFGYKFIPYTKGSNNGPRSAGFRVYNDKWDLVDWVLIDTTQGKHLTFQLKKLPNKEIISASSHNDTLQLNKYNYEGELIQQKKIPYENDLSSIGIFPVTESTFLVRSNNLGRFYNTDFEKISDLEVKFNYGSKFIVGSNKLVTLQQSYNVYYNETDILVETFEGDTVALHENVIGWGELVGLQKIDNNEFILTYKLNGKYWIKVYDNNGTLIRDEVLIETSNENPTRDFAVNFGEDKIRFTWSEARVPGEGFNIYSSIYDKSLITTVESNESNELPTKLVLEQNYPNPFNPSTTIKFIIPIVETTRQVVSTKLVVYDILGREIKILLNRELQPGEYKIEFDADNLPSGVYFYHLDAGELSKSKKMLLIK